MAVVVFDELFDIVIVTQQSGLILGDPLLGGLVCSVVEGLSQRSIDQSGGSLLRFDACELEKVVDVEENILLDSLVL